MEKVLEKRIKKYVLAAIQDNYCWYLRSLGQDKGFEMVTDIEIATKTLTKKIAKTIREIYKHEYGNNALDLVIIPLIIDYNLVKEESGDINEL